MTTAARTQTRARYFRGALLFVFAAATILPFCSSFFMCAMPCCHGTSTPRLAMSMPMPACPGSPTEGCAPTISGTSDRTSATAVTPTVSTIKLTVVATAVIAPPATSAIANAEAAPLIAPAALHLLNSVFRI